MSDEQTITSGRLMTRFAQLGPYLRQNKSTEAVYFFDCLATCVNAKKSPENREFWGWWLLLKAEEGVLEYSYDFGMYDLKGDWTQDALPTSCTAEVKQSLDDFYIKLKGLCDEVSLVLKPESNSKTAQLG